MRVRAPCPSTLCLCLLACVGCTVYTTRPGNTPGSTPPPYIDARVPGPSRGIGITSNDIISMTSRMVRDMLANARLGGRRPAPRVIVDAEYFRNESASRINRNIITDRLRIGLNRAANGRLVFLARHHSDMVEKERALKGTGTVTPGTATPSPAPHGGDYRLGGRITDLNAFDPKTGMTERYHHIAFEMVDLETSEIVWGHSYEFKKYARDDIMYR